MKKPSRPVRGELVDPRGVPIRALSDGQLQARSAALQELVNTRRRTLTNTLEGLAARMGGLTQDNITSMLPLFTSNIFAPLTTNYTLLTYLWKSHGVLQTAIDEPVQDAFRDEPELTSKELGEDSRKKQEKGEDVDEEPLGEGSVGAGGLGELLDFAEENGVWEELKFLGSLGRLYGGAGLVVNAGQDPGQPLDARDVKKGFLEFYAADRWEFAGAWRTAKSFLFYGQKLDASRVITFSGKRAPRLIRSQLAGWGMSEIERMAEDFNMWLRGRNVLYEILDEAKVDVYSIKDFAQTLLTPDGEQIIASRLMAANQLKNFHNALVMDSEDEYHVVANSFTGLADVMRENRIGIACATRIPFRKLFGSAAESGMGGSGAEQDNENYNAMVTSSVRAPMKPILRRVLKLMMVAVFGRPYDVRIDWRPLPVMTAKEEEDIKSSKQERYQNLYKDQIIDSKELGEALHHDRLFPLRTKAQLGKRPAFPALPSFGAMYGGKEGGGDNGGGAEGGGGGDGGGKPAAGAQEPKAD